MKIPSPDSWPRWSRYLTKVLALMSCVVIAWQSLVSVGQGGSIPHLDKLLHLAVYFVLAALMRLGWWHIWGGFILIICVIFGFGLEFLQGAVAQGRTASLADGLANTAGALLALYLIPRLWR